MDVIIKKYTISGQDFGGHGGVKGILKEEDRRRIEEKG